MKELSLTNSTLKALVDDEDFEKCSQVNWQKHKKGQIYNRKGSLAVFIKGPGFWDHKDQNKLNNQKENLRPSSVALNNRNRKKFKQNATIKYKGVSRSVRDSAWKAAIRFNGKDIHLGYFNTEEQAALRYNQEALKLHGDFASINEVESGG